MKIMQKDIQRLQEELKFEREKNELLLDQVDVYRTETDGEIDRLKSDLDESRQELATTQMELDDVQQQKMKMSAQMDILRQEMKTKQKQLSAEIEKNECLRKQLIQMEVDRERADSEIQSLKSKLDALRVELTANQSHMNKSKKDSSTEIEQLQMDDSDDDSDDTSEDDSGDDSDDDDSDGDDSEDTDSDDDLSGKYRKYEEELRGKMREKKSLKNETNTVRHVGESNMPTFVFKRTSKYRTPGKVEHLTKIEIPNLATDDHDNENALIDFVPLQRAQEPNVKLTDEKRVAKGQLNMEAERIDNNISKDTSDAKNLQAQETVGQDISSGIKRLKSELEAKQMTIDNLKKRNDDLMQQLATTELSCHRMEQKLVAQRKANQDLKEQLAFDREENKTTHNRLKSDWILLAQNLDGTRSELEEDRTHQSAMDKFREDSSQKYEKVDPELSGKMIEIDNLMNQMDFLRQESSTEIERLQSTLDTNQVKVDNLSGESQRLSALFERKNLIRRSISCDVDVAMQQLSVQVEATEISDPAMEDTSNTESKVNEEPGEPKVLNLEKTNTELERLNSDLDDTRLKLEEQREQNTAHRKDISKQMEKYDQLLREQAILKKANAELKQKMTAETVKNEMLSSCMNSHFGEMNSEIQRLKSELDDVRKEFEQQMTRNERHQEHLCQEAEDKNRSRYHSESAMREHTEKTDIDRCTGMDGNDPSISQDTWKQLAFEHSDADRSCTPSNEVGHTLRGQIPYYEDLMDKQKELLWTRDSLMSKYRSSSSIQDAIHERRESRDSIMRNYQPVLTSLRAFEKGKLRF